MQSGVSTRVLHNILPKARVHHPVHGDGVVAKILPHDKRNKPYNIVFDNGESHHYSMQSAAKFIMGDKCFAQLGVEERMV